jgi:hypothetical protein
MMEVAEQRMIVRNEVPYQCAKAAPTILTLASTVNQPLIIESPYNPSIPCNCTSKRYTTVPTRQLHVSSTARPT